MLLLIKTLVEEGKLSQGRPNWRRCIDDILVWIQKQGHGVIKTIKKNEVSWWLATVQVDKGEKEEEKNAASVNDIFMFYVT